MSDCTTSDFVTDSLAGATLAADSLGGAALCAALGGTTAALAGAALGAAALTNGAALSCCCCCGGGCVRNGRGTLWTIVMCTGTAGAARSDCGGSR